ncbi:MAG: hypothetical protein ACJAQT_000582 [Akkermansiaceae bacterium]|jgi:hypothetical protein
MKRSFEKLLPLLALVLSTSPLAAGNYSQAFTGFSTGTTALGDGSAISSNDGTAQIRVTGDPYLRLTASGTGSTGSSMKLPDLDPGKAIDSFTVSFDLFIGGGGSLADGASLTFGDIASGNGGGEAGFGVDNGLVIAWDTFNNGGDNPSVEVFADGVSIDNNLHNYGSTSNDWVPVVLHWDGSGFDVTYDGDVLAANLPTPGFVPAAGDRFAFSGRTGGSTQNTYIDDLSFATTTATAITTGGPVIYEFVADNADSFEDEDLETPDWLEIYNGKATSQNLDGYYLSNDPAQKTMWRIPAVTMDAYGYLTIFASSKDRLTTGAPLHTNFSLPKIGGYLALIAPDGTTVLTEFNYTAQAEDVSYGELGQSRSLGFLERPTPNAINSGMQAAGPPAEDVQFDKTGGVFSGSTSLAILPTTSPGAVVRYTTNGTVPNESSSVYSSAFNISTTSTVRARVFEAGRLSGEIKSRTLIELSSNVQSFSSNLPIIIVDSAGVNIDLANNPSAPRPFRPVYTVVIDRDSENGLASINDAPDFTGRGGMHVRGQSSSGFPKKQYAWETWTNEDEDKDVSILGMPSESDWILYAPYSDKTLMRNALVYESARAIRGNFGGVRTRYVEVFFNSNGGTVSLSDYRGVYVMMEKIKRDKERVDVEKLSDLVTDPALITGGYIFKKDKGPYSSPWNTATENIPLDMHYPETPNAAQFNYLKGYVDEMEEALHSPTFSDPGSGYRAFIEADTFVDAHLFTETFKDIDGYRISTYYSKSRGGKIRALPVWDFNLGLGNADYLEGESPTGWYYPLINSPNYYWYQRLFQDTEFDLEYWDRFWQLRRSLFSTPSMMSAIDRHDSELDGDSGSPNAVTRNFDEWNILGTYVWPNASGSGSRTTHQSEVDWMKNWLAQRLTWMETQSRGTSGLAQPPAFNQYGGEVNAGFDLSMTESNGWGGAQIYYTLDGSDPRLGPNPSVTLIGADAPCEVIVPSTTNGGSTLTVTQWTSPANPPNIANWTSGTQGVGYERSSDNLYDPYFNLDVEAAMFSQNATCYIRIPFTISSQAELDDLEALTLKMRYDDSFVAYLNGTEIVREANAPATLTYNSGADGNQDDSAAINYTNFPVTGGTNQLQVGENMLAIHGLNRGQGSSDALWACILEASQGAINTIAPSAQIYSSNIDLQTSVDVRARVYDGSKWSPLSRANFVVNTVPAAIDNLVISEIHYRPAAPTPEEEAAGFLSRGDFEYLELLNIDPVNSISLEGISFTNGITFAGFDNNLPANARVLPSGGRVLLVNNLAAFNFRHPGLTVAGEYSGSLKNEGEQVTLMDAGSMVIRDFIYDDIMPWPVSAGDGSGFSLVLSDPSSNPNHADPLSWRSSVDLNGSPGGDDSQPFLGNPTDDLDGDGYNALLEYAFGTNDSDNASLPNLQLLTEAVGADDHLVIAFQLDLAAVGIQHLVQASDDLSAWGDATDLVHLSTSNNGDGTATLKYQSTSPAAALSEWRFYRIQISQQP